jgi:hypothetical protein
MTDRDFDLLKALTWKVRGLSLLQVARGWWKASPSGEREARRRLTALEASGLVRFICAFSRTHLDAKQGPLLAWFPDDGLPDFDRLSYLAAKRNRGPLRKLPCVVATEKAARLTGGSARGFSHPLQAGHDLNLGEVLLWYRENAPLVASGFLGEALIESRKNFRVPDAVFRDEAGRTHLLIEVAGEYSAAEFQSLHRLGVESTVPYVVW